MNGQTMKLYVCGFYFDPERKHVILLQKNYPAGYKGDGRLQYQNGFLNGAGGLLPVQHGPIEQHMSDLFKKDTGVSTGAQEWRMFSHMVYSDAVCMFCWATAKDIASFKSASTQGDEKVVIAALATITPLPILADLRYLLPMALEHHDPVTNPAGRVRICEILDREGTTTYMPAVLHSLNYEVKSAKQQAALGGPAEKSTETPAPPHQGAPFNDPAGTMPSGNQL